MTSAEHLAGKFGQLPMSAKHLVLAALLVVLCACGKTDNKPAAPPDKSDSQVLTLTAAEISSLGLTTQTAQAASYRGEIKGYGTIVALDTIAQADADFMSAQAAAAQSRAAAARARFLFVGQNGAVSREAMEVAQSKADVDQAALALARRKTEALFGRDAPWEKAASRAAIMARLSSGRTVLVRVSFPLGGVSQRPAQLVISRLGVGAHRWTATTVWDAPSDPEFPGPGYLALLDGSDLAQNEHVTASVPAGAALSGVTVPANAVVYSEDQAWVFVEQAPGRYLRLPIDTQKATEGGYFAGVDAGIRPGQRVVVNGAGLLLARQRNPGTGPGE